MPAWLILSLQTVSGPALPRDDLRVPVLKRCTPGVGDDIVVCGRTDPDAYRLKPLPERYEAVKGPPRAELGLSDREKLGVEVEQGSDAQGGPISRVMARYKLRF
ncbi:hypothetical protein COC42_08240 [Sphingomonas spermidinifaciens]|uniref:Uncharacterized protein n=1 Tax=Sphingomonas spermidinifaciens TaxID=1141889 RepID=A0A2A4B9G1_9SPHN|nr:hypothetical protein [Sphingomonas spermidinifaciens]PCD04264.1 hypothetical protein COC42_08240 [Sphingomonas spermidinifaciens]